MINFILGFSIGGFVSIIGMVILANVWKYQPDKKYFEKLEEQVSINERIALSHERIEELLNEKL